MDAHTYSFEARRERVSVRARHRYFTELVRTDPDVAAALKESRRTLKKEKANAISDS